MSRVMTATRRQLRAHVWTKEPDGFYVEPEDRQTWERIGNCYGLTEDLRR
jgi:hypothetical protein